MRWCGSIKAPVDREGDWGRFQRTRERDPLMSDLKSDSSLSKD